MFYPPPRIHFVHPRITADFKNWHFLKVSIFIRILHTTQYCAILRWFETSKIPNPFTKWPRRVGKVKHISKFFKYVLNFSRIHFGHPRTITAFKNWNYFKITVFQGFPYTRFGHFGLILGVKSSKLLQKMSKKWWNMKIKVDFFENILNSPWIHFGLPRTITTFKNQILSTFRFFRVSHTSDLVNLDSFLA